MQTISFKALTLKQPWAWLVARGYKKVENRTWTTNHRGRLAIHVSKSDSDLSPEVSSFVSEALAKSGLSTALPSLDELKAQQGLVIATVDLVSVERDEDEPLAPFALPSQYHWILANPLLLEPPIEARGQMGLWNVYLPIQHLY